MLKCLIDCSQLNDDFRAYLSEPLIANCKWVVNLLRLQRKCYLTSDYPSGATTMYLAVVHGDQALTLSAVCLISIEFFVESLAHHSVRFLGSC